MDTGITVAVILAMIVIGIYLIRRLNAQHDERIALHRYSRSVRGPRGTHRATRPPVGGPAPAAAPSRRDLGAGIRARLRPQHRGDSGADRATKGTKGTKGTKT
ncbi:hypothetical protein DSC45_24565 [Streptomyces sp. YIM 130001]|uniref:hypothetical protein n=1 Tax=Streptomyces sp. YIM 130001 TaxID=2259644 RepID=UPI000E65CC8F|nr:hypothetical protein [Streptomyces sp. YIM 130001]RII13027.1 hypothetical protein DSC45_24565 [Streptomyces sp. YIM 130001]